jgi:hypothetical protein
MHNMVIYPTVDIECLITWCSSLGGRLCSKLSRRSAGKTAHSGCLHRESIRLCAMVQGAYVHSHQVSRVAELKEKVMSSLQCFLLGNSEIYKHKKVSSPGAMSGAATSLASLLQSASNSNCKCRTPCGECDLESAQSNWSITFCKLKNIQFNKTLILFSHIPLGVS